MAEGGRARAEFLRRCGKGRESRAAASNASIDLSGGSPRISSLRMSSFCLFNNIHLSWQSPGIMVAPMTNARRDKVAMAEKRAI